MAEVTDKEKDPVCGMLLEATETEDTSTFEGSTYYFCGLECKKQFDANPHSFIKKMVA